MTPANKRRLLAWRKRWKSADLPLAILSHEIRMKCGIDWNCRQIPRQFQLVDGGPYYIIERGRLALNQARRFLPVKEPHT